MSTRRPRSQFVQLLRRTVRNEPSARLLSHGSRVRRRSETEQTSFSALSSLGSHQGQRIGADAEALFHTRLCEALSFG